MKRLLFLLLVLVCSVSYGQTYQSMPQAGYGPVKRMLFDSVVTLPMGITSLRNISGGRDTAQIRYNKADSSIYVYTGSQWVKSSGSGSTIDTTSLSNRINTKLSTSDSTIYYTKFRSDSSRTNIYSAIGGKLSASDTTNKFLTSVSQPNDSSLTFVKGSTASTYIIRSSIAASATRLVTTVYNNTGATILKGAVVYINGRHSSNLPTIALAEGDNETNSYKTFALVDANIPTSSSGLVVQAGNISGLNLPTSTYTDGDILYLSPTTPGGYTTTKPLAPNHICKLGSVTRAHPTLGAIEIKIENGWQLDELSDVQIPLVPNDSTVLQFSRTDSLWHAVSTNTVLNGRMETKQDTSTSWKTGGNFNVNASQFIGSRNNASLRLRTNNTERVVIDSIGSVGIGTSLAAASSILDITSTKGLLIPRVSTSGRDNISSPASQLLVSNTTKKTLDQYNGTSWNSIAGDFNKDILGLQALGSPVKSSPIGVNFLPSTGGAFVGSRSYFNAIVVDKEITITGAMWYQVTQGVYIGTGGNYNGIALYSQSGGTLTLIDSTARDTTIWKAASASWNQKAFAGGSRTLQPGVYYLFALSNTLGGSYTTAPSIGVWGSFNLSNSMSTNSAKLYGGTINTVTIPPTTQAMSAWNNFSIYFSLYLY